MNISFKVLIVIFLIFCVSIISATIINVPGDQPTIQEGINVAVDSDTVLVQPGTYTENINYNGNNITVASLFLTTQDTIYISQTIIDGNQNGSVVTFESGEDSTAMLSGLTLTNGLGGSSYPNHTGGGIYCYNSNPSIINVFITGNYAVHGGGIYCEFSNPNMLNITIIDNSAEWGGGIQFYESSPSLENVKITGNYADGGGGISCSHSSNPSLKNVTITDNFANAGYAGSGGGIYCMGNSSPNLENVSITGNSVDGLGGGIYCYGTSPSLVNVTIKNNSADCGGGGIYCIDYSSPSLVNVIIINNSTESHGGGFFCTWDSNPSLVNVTITDNSADSDGGGIYSGLNSNPSLVNCILWNNIPDEVYDSAEISYSNIQGGWTGEGNIDANPLFAGIEEDPYSLLGGSPCIDAGIPDTTGLNLPPWDIIGNLRIWDGDGNGSAIIDMGAYEYGAPPYVELDDNLIVQIPDIYLHQNYPNPFNPQTTISFNLSENGKVNLSIYNIKGQKIKTIVNEKLEQGLHQITWDGKNDNNQYVASGVYFYKLKVNDKNIAIKKCLLLK